MRTILAFWVITAMTVACSSEPAITTNMLDGGAIFDPSIYKPALYMVSKAMPTPTAAQAQRPVIIACHGYSGTTFEWGELRTWANGRTDFYLFQVLLGGHGRSYEDFKKSTWHDWRDAIMIEYEALRKAGYKNISLFESSTSGLLLLQLVAWGYSVSRPAVPREISCWLIRS